MLNQTSTKSYNVFLFSEYFAPFLFHCGSRSFYYYKFFLLLDVYEKAVLFEILSFPPFITKAVLFGSAKITNVYLV